jgi:thioredoxin-like negative regulator of GroEL
MKVDVDECKSLAERHGVSRMPTFRLFKNQALVAEVVGSDAVQLEAAISRVVGEEFVAEAEWEGGKEVSVDGHVCDK